MSSTKKKISTKPKATAKSAVKAKAIPKLDAKLTSAIVDAVLAQLAAAGVAPEGFPPDVLHALLLKEPRRFVYPDGTPAPRSDYAGGRYPEDRSGGVGPTFSDPCYESYKASLEAIRNLPKAKKAAAAAAAIKRFTDCMKRPPPKAPTNY